MSGGVRLTGWRQMGDGRWQVPVPAVARGEWSFTQLFVKGGRRYRPRLPKEGYYRIARAVPPATKDGPLDKFQFEQGQFGETWPDLADIEVLIFHSWTMDRMRVKSVDAARRVVTFTAPTLGNNWFFDLRTDKRFIIENVGAALSAPGEWYLDRPRGLLTYLPLPGENMARAEIVAPRLECLLQVRGQGNLGLPVEHLVFRGLTFAHSNWQTPAAGWRCGQSESALPGAVRFSGARDCALDGCTVTHIGTYGVEIGNGCERVRVENCELTDLAAGGVKIGDFTGLGTPRCNVVRNNLIAHGGRMHAAGMGVWVVASPGNLIEHNEICDFYQTGVSVGWSWGYGANPCRDNTVAYNRIHDIGQGVTDDMGGIYTLGLSPGTVLHHNIIHDVSCCEYGGRGIYFDEGTSDILAENNLVYRTDTGAFMHHYGRDDRVLNNILALSRGGQIDRLREEEHTSFEFRHNLVYYEPPNTCLAENWNNDRYVMDENLYWNTSGQPVRFGAWSLEQWRQKGHDRNSLIADPLFRDPSGGDFSLREGSPALKVGFRPFDMREIGRLGRRRGEPECPLAPRAFPPKPGPRPPRPIREDFEDLQPGDITPDAILSEENDRATIRVTAETAASGRHSLKFTDAAGQKANYNPHTYYRPGFAEGVIEGHLDIRLEPGMSFYHEWRDVTVFYRSGPLLRFAPDGTLSAGDKALMKLPHSQWVGIDIVCGLGKRASAQLVGHKAMATGAVNLQLVLEFLDPVLHLTAVAIVLI